MSKKTRKQKILADLREKRKPSLLAMPNIEVKVTKSQSGQNQSLYIYPVQLIRKDLTKTLLLSILAVSLEIALFLILEKHLVLPFRIN
jgi:hypothetical protein